MNRTIIRRARTATAIGFAAVTLMASSALAAQSRHLSMHVTRTGTPSCPSGYFCFADIDGHVARTTDAVPDVGTKGMVGPADWVSNQTNDTWCIYQDTYYDDLAPDAADAKIDPNVEGTSTFDFNSLQPEHSFGIC